MDRKAEALVDDMTTHGGKREGAGRKPTGTAKILVSKKLDRDIVEYLRTCENATAVIEELIRKSKGFREWQKQRDATA